MWSIWTLLKMNYLLAFALLEITAAKGSAARWEQRRSKSTTSGTVLLERTSQSLYLSSYSAELKDVAMALVDPPSVARRASTMLCVPACNPSSGVTDDSTASVLPNSSVCDDEKLAEILVQDLNFLEEPLSISGDHVPPDQVERVNHEDELLSLEGEEDEAPSKVCIQQNPSSMDTAQLNNIKVHSDSQSDNAST